MSQSLGLRRHWFVLVCGAFLCAGCGSNGVKVEGKLVKDGQPYTVAQGESLALSFNGKGPQGEDQIYPATVNGSDGTFVASGVEGKGIPPGKYQLQVNRTLMGSDPASVAKMAVINRELKAINGKEVELTNDPVQKLTIDVAKGTVSK